VQKRSYLFYLVLIFGLLISGLLLNCTRENNPLSFSSNNAGQNGGEQQRKLIPFTNQSRTFLKLFQDSSWVSIQNGGELNLDYNGDNEPECKLTVLPGTISEDAMLSMSIDDSVFAITFGPHGIIFSEPALLDIHAYGLDLSNVDPNTIDIYYDNTDTGTWERMERDTIIVNVAEGNVFVKNARIPHFSRYALSGD